MKILTADTEIFDLLEKAGKAGFDPGKTMVMEFMHEEKWCLLIFNPSGELKGCKLFLIDEQVFSQEAEKLLIPELLALEDNHGYDRLKNEALAIVEHALRDRKNQQSYFDAH
jgi:hypothetical protein